jgi:hypothetical protein
MQLSSPWWTGVFAKPRFGPVCFREQTSPVVPEPHRPDVRAAHLKTNLLTVGLGLIGSDSTGIGLFDPFCFSVFFVVFSTLFALTSLNQS